MTVRAPLRAPDSPPETGASMNPTPRRPASSCSSWAKRAEAVVWSTSTDPAAIDSSAPPGAAVTDRTSSLPTQTNTISVPAAACAGVGAAEPSCSPTQASARAAVRL